MSGSPFINRTFPCVKDVTLVKADDNTEGGIGAGNVIAVGLGPLNDAKHRTELEFEGDFSGLVVLNEAMLRLRVSNNQVSGPGAAVKFYVERVTENFKEGNYSDVGGKGASNSERWPGKNSTVTHRVLYEGSPDDQDVISVNITGIVQDVWDDEERAIRIRLIAADGAGDYEEDNTARFSGFWAREKGNDGQGYRPRIEIVGDPRQAARKPASVTPATTNRGEEGEAPTRVDRTFTIKGIFSSPDAGDYLTADQVQFFPKTATDDGNGNVTGGAEITSVANTGVKTYTRGSLSITHTVVIPAPYIGHEIRGRIRVRGRSGRWGPWTRLADMRIIPNSRPTAPTKLSVDSGSATPDYQGRHNDPDPGSTVSAVESQVVKDLRDGSIEGIQNTTSYRAGDPRTGPFTTLNGDGAQKVSGIGTHWRITHEGRALAPGERIRRRHRTVDQFGAVGEWSGWEVWVVGELPVPTVLPGPDAKADSLTPAIGARYPQNIKGLWVEVYREKAATAPNKLWVTAERSFAPTTQKQFLYGSIGKAKALTWSQVIWVRVKVRVNQSGDTSPWSELQPVTINSIPRAPTVTILNAELGSDDVWYVPTRTPRILPPFKDDDLPNDHPTKQLTQVFTSPAGVNPVWQQLKTSAIESFVDVPASAGLIYEKAYTAKVRYADTSGQYGPFGVFEFTTHRPPTVVTGVPPDPNDPTPTINWTATFYGGAEQAGYQIIVRRVTDGDDDVIYDSDFVEDSEAESVDLPAYLLEDGEDYEVQVYITDTYGG